ncbi:membrane-bound O-acyltransferase domain-containing protein 2 [Folsomia candida]|uniref:Membrane-bound O-acyltransferase domain-containing protein 2 n=1 Tax=Folsomia candida TaxID=158441 RepID=A0A226EJU5_FOLCA|nr:membrane-bound O-acyltransferase domain-containing protein 2 [Folsomia candida]XP_021947617.1 membrane-bound O-acyltransferase domain-containing protein 2 [Folsomia candida]OXA57729.1 Membrane-bound O-acyltransferase domain-containing protein 2 [Folsomia candida]
MGNKGDLLLSEYTGSTSLLAIAEFTSLSIDQINFIACQFLAVILSFILKKYVKHPRARLMYCLISGICICNFCFGVQIFHVLISAGLSFVLIRYCCRSTYMPWYVFIVSMLYLAWLHMRRQFLAPGYSLDITAPLMVLTQKVTSLAFAINDGKKQKADKKNSELEKAYAISEVPDALEFWSYIFQFQSMLAGPLVFFKDFRQFIYYDESPSSVVVVLKKLFGSIFFALLYLKVAPSYNISHLREEEFLQRAFWNKIVFIHVSTSLERSKYYHAWILSDAVCNASGLGYKKETKSWDLVTNVDALAFELGTNFKNSLDQWNIGTMKWLRYVVYDRCSPRIRTVATYACSACWHGFYPGYYITFFSGALFTSSARIVRRLIRPHFMMNTVLKSSYDFTSWFITRVVIAYASFSFCLLDFFPSLNVYRSLYFFVHIAALAVFLLPTIKSLGRKNNAVSSSTNGVRNGIMNNGNSRHNDPLHVMSKQRHSNSDPKIVTAENEMTKLKTG